MQEQTIYTSILQIGGFYFFWVMIHYSASHLYIRWCTPPTWVGLITSPFLVTTPHCTALRWSIYHGSDIIHGMWIVLGSWILLYIQNIAKNIIYVTSG